MYFEMINFHLIMVQLAKIPQECDKNHWQNFSDYSGFAHNTVGAIHELPLLFVLEIFICT